MSPPPLLLLLASLFVSGDHRRIVAAAGAAVVVALVVKEFLLLGRRPRRRMMFAHLVKDGTGNETLVVRGAIAGVPSLFMVDTAYAGAPVLSTSYLSLLFGKKGKNGTGRTNGTLPPVPSSASERQRQDALRTFVWKAGCRTYTSGCTMRLMGIGETTETSSDLLLCPPLRDAAGRGGGGGIPSFHLASDLFVTHSLPGNVHVLTMDYLLHRSPVALLPAKGKILFEVDDPGLRDSFQTTSRPRMVGGAMAVQFEVGGANLSLVVDTGAAVSVSVASSSVHLLTTCSPHSSNTAMRTTQTGVNGERVCSDAMVARVRVGEIDLGEVEVFANSTEVEGADGYVGIALLRCLDMWIAPGLIGFRRNELRPTTSSLSTLSSGSCPDASPPSCLRSARSS